MQSRRHDASPAHGAGGGAGRRPFSRRHARRASRHSARTAGEPARVAGIAPPTATGHLHQLVAGGLLTLAVQGRHRYFRLASPDVARMLEAIMVVAGHPLGAEVCRPPRIDPALREARTCYDHLAGRRAVALADSFVAGGALVLDGEAGEVTGEGRAWV